MIIQQIILQVNELKCQINEYLCKLLILGQIINQVAFRVLVRFDVVPGVTKPTKLLVDMLLHQVSITLAFNRIVGQLITVARETEVPFEILDFGG